MTDIPKGATIVHVNRGVIDSNRKKLKAGETEGLGRPIAVKKGKSGKAEYGTKAVIYDRDGRRVGAFLYNPGGLLACGAKVALIMDPGCEVRTEIEN